jgi:hypothetical protein
MGHRQVTEVYLGSLARRQLCILVSFDKVLVALHTDVGVAVEALCSGPSAALQIVESEGST